MCTAVYLYNILYVVYDKFVYICYVVYTYSDNTTIFYNISSLNIIPLFLPPIQYFLVILKHSLQNHTKSSDIYIVWVRKKHYWPILYVQLVITIMIILSFIHDVLAAINTFFKILKHSLNNSKKYWSMKYLSTLYEVMFSKEFFIW